MRISDWSSDVCSSDLLADGDPLLLEAYQHKIVKEEAAASFVINEPQMRAAISKAERLVADLERDLAASTGPWLFGDRFTLADLFWAVSLYRFLWLGYSGFWKDGAGKPCVEAYANRLFTRPSVRDARSDEHTSELQSLMRISYAVF